MGASLYVFFSDQGRLFHNTGGPPVCLMSQDSVTFSFVSQLLKREIGSLRLA